jgi:hypothetical protein
MDWAGWALFGLVATAVLTAIMISPPSVTTSATTRRP